MKLQIASDLHLEFLQRRFPLHLRVARLGIADADVLVLAGDIGDPYTTMMQFADWPIPVLWVLGNHEFYGSELEQIESIVQDRTRGTRITLLIQGSTIIGNVRFLGCTLWTDYLLRGTEIQADLMHTCEAMLNDHRLIRSRQSEYGGFSARDALRLHQADRAWLEAELARPFEGKTVVITHHGVHPNSIHEQYKKSSLNAAFVSDLSPIIPLADLWVHGHVHNHFDYRVDGLGANGSGAKNARVVVNPGGYPRNLRSAQTFEDLEWENPAFQPSCIVEV